jgi:2,4-dienoyl-CoA reductase (NADPH2)
VAERGNFAPGFAHLDRDDRIPSWRELISRVHEHGCPYIVQIGFAGRNRELAGIQYEKGLSSTDKADLFRGFACVRMTVEQIAEVVDDFAQAAGRAREAGADGIELHGANGFVITQFLSKEINDRTDEYGGSLENRARFPLEIVRAVRAQVGDDFHVQFKISAREHMRELYPWGSDGNTLAESIQVCRWLEEAGVDAFSISTGTAFPHPRMPPGRMPLEEFARGAELATSGEHPFRNLILFRTPVKYLVRAFWERPARGREEGLLLPDAEAVKRAVSVPVFCVGGFQTASVIRDALERGRCDAAIMARGLLANPDLVRMFEQGIDRPPKPCTYCNKCLLKLLEHPVGCYDESRFASRADMHREIMSFFDPEPAADAGD